MTPKWNTFSSLLIKSMSQAINSPDTFATVTSNGLLSSVVLSYLAYQMSNIGPLHMFGLKVFIKYNKTTLLKQNIKYKINTYLYLQ